MPWGVSFSNPKYPFYPCTPFSREIIDLCSSKSQFYLKKVNKRQINQLLIIKETCPVHVFDLSSVHLASLVVSES
jgi:hypothetical protein